MSHTGTPLLALATLAEYREPRQHLFPSDSSLAWYIRQHRAQLVETGALVKHLNQWHALPKEFDDYVLEAGKRAAATSTGLP